MPYEPPFARNDAIDSLCMEIAELVGMIPPDAPLASSPVLHRELRIKTIHSSLLIEGNSFPSHAVPQFAAHYSDGIGILPEFKKFIDL